MNMMRPQIFQIPVYRIMLWESLTFVIFLIHACAAKWNKLSPEVFDILQKSNCISDYLVPYYDVLHTQGEKYLVDDIESYLMRRGMQV